MACACLDRFFGAPSGPENGVAFPSCRVLDPACGDGAFLLEIFDELCRRWRSLTSRHDPTRDRNGSLDGPAVRQAIVRDCIFGVDIDSPAVEALRKKLLERIAGPANLLDEAAAVVHTNIRHGDSLAGQDFEPNIASSVSGRRLVEHPTSGGRGSRRAANQRFSFDLGSAEASLRAKERWSDLAGPDSINWRRDFPTAAKAGGFDIIIGNPPYVRERNAKPLFDALAATELGRKWREARMDLWYYFVHRSLDLLRPGGMLSFIVNSYWMSSRGAGRLIERLRRETAFEEIVLLDDAPIFKAVAGRHMIFRLRKTGPGLSPEPSAHGGPGSAISQLLSGGRDSVNLVAPAECRIVTPSDEYTVPHDDLFQAGRLVVARSDTAQAIFKDRTTLDEWFETRQGMAENPPAINRRLHGEFAGRYSVGAGVFVLQPDEVERLNLSTAERALLRPYYDTKAVGRYRLTAQPTHQVLYLSRSTAPTLTTLPNIAAHLEPFRPILERRREVRNGRIAWWHLHWPRDEQIFVWPRVLCVQMGRRPQFVFAEQPTFVGFSINLILSNRRLKSGTENGGLFQSVVKTPEGVALDVLTGILNSDLAWTWFDRHAKRRGINLEINAHLLRQFPLPGRDEELERAVGQLVRDRQAVLDGTSQTSRLDREIEEIVVRLYDAKITRDLGIGISN
jgi:hypothetical protein